MNTTKQAIQASVQREQRGDGGCVKDVPSEIATAIQSLSSKDFIRLMVRLSPRVLTEEQFLSQSGAGFDFGDAGLHRQPGSTPNSRARAVKHQSSVDCKLFARRNKLREEYAAAVERGEIRPPTRMERLLAGAKGHSDNPSTSACRRLLAKRGIDWRTGKKDRWFLNSL